MRFTTSNNLNQTVSIQLGLTRNCSTNRVNQVLEGSESFVKILLGVGRHDPRRRSLLFTIIIFIDSDNLTLVYHVKKTIQEALKREPRLTAFHGDARIVY